MRYNPKAVLGIAVVLLVVAVSALLVEGRKPPLDVQSAAETFSGYLSLSSPAPVTVERLSRATNPERFTAAMSKVSYGDSVHYSTTHGLAASAQASLYSGGKLPIPYPPTEAWCAALSNGETVVVAQHHDLYNADWLLHQINDQAATTSLIGCDSK